MKLSSDVVLSRVPLNVPNRDALARLLVTVETALVGIEKNATDAEWYRRLYEVADLILLADDSPSDTVARCRVNAAINSTRCFAFRHGCTPSTIRGIRSEARLIAETIR